MTSVRGRDGGDDRRTARLRRLAKRIDDRGLGREMQGVDDRRGECGRAPDRGPVECVVVHHVVGVLANRLEESFIRCHEGCQVGRRRCAGAVEESTQCGGVDSDIDNMHAVDCRPRGRVDVHIVATHGEAGGEICEQGLRTAALGLANRRHQRCDQRKPQRRSTLYARSRGGLTPSRSYGTRASARARTSPAACG